MSRIRQAGACLSSERGLVEHRDASIDRINRILDEQRGDLKLRDLIEGESEKLMDEALSAEQKEIDSQI